MPDDAPLPADEPAAPAPEVPLPALPDVPEPDVPEPDVPEPDVPEPDVPLDVPPAPAEELVSKASPPHAATSKAEAAKSLEEVDISGGSHGG